MVNKILTVVVPTYNAESFLRDNLESFCIEEILADIEVLIVNDGSTDNSLIIAEEFTRKFPETYRAMTKENGGHGSGINYGIRYACGKYFKVVDADDWVDRDSFIKLVKFLKKSNSDIVYSGFLWAFDDGQKELDLFKKKAEFKEPFKDVVYEQEYLFDEIVGQVFIKMHNMTVKTDILKYNNIVIDEHCFYVDTEYILYPIPYVKTVSFLPGYVYLYRIGRQGQSVGIEKMQQYESNYDKVLTSLLHFYDLLGDIIPCSLMKKQYIASVIARVIAGKIKIMLSFPATKEKKRQLILYNETIKREYPDVYISNCNKAVMILRKTNYAAYLVANILVRRKY